MRIRPWLLAAIMLTFCSCIFLMLEWRRRSRDFSDPALLMRLPDKEGSCLYLNIQALRQAGLLEAIAGQRADEEAEYRGFVRVSGFDYRDDLDAVMVHFGLDFELYIARGRFQWEQISRYLKSYGPDVRCSNGVCSIPVSNGRYLSAMPLSDGVVAIGVGPNRTVVYSAFALRQHRISQLPAAPFWVELSEDFLKNPRRLPEGTRAFVSAVNSARHVFISVKPSGGGLEARLLASFSSTAEAAARRTQLEESTTLLKKFFERDNQQPQASNIASALVSGAFEQKDTEVVGRWPVPSALFQKVVAGN